MLDLGTDNTEQLMAQSRTPRNKKNLVVRRLVSAAPSSRSFGPLLLKVLSGCAVALLLSGCINSDDENSTGVVAPINALDFPSASQVVATDGDMTVSGIAVARTNESVVEQIALSVDDGTDAAPIALDPIVNNGEYAQPPYTPEDAPYPVFSWQQLVSVDTLPLGVSAVSSVATFGEYSIANSFFAARGSSWMWQADLQKDASGQWFLLDSARKALLKIDLDTGAQTLFSASGDNNGVAMDKPVDFVIDGNRALVVDSRLAAIIAIDLGSGARSVLSDAATPSSGVAFIQPVAITIDAANDAAYVADQGRVNLVKVALDTGAREEFAVNPAAEEPALVFPLDIAFQQQNVGDRLFVTDATANEVIVIDVATGVSGVFAAPEPVVENNENEALDSETEDAGTEETETLVLAYSQVRQLALQDGDLYVSDAGPFTSSGFIFYGAIFKVNVSGNVDASGAQTLDGEKTLLSAASSPNTNNLFRSPQALVFDDRKTPATADDDRLLVLDNQLGAIVAVAAQETDPDGTPEVPVSLGARTFLPGSVTLDQADFDAGKGSSAQGLAADAISATSVTLHSAVDVLNSGSGMFVIDESQNTLVSIDLQTGTRARFDQALGGNSSDSEEQQAVDFATFESTRFDRPVLLQVAPTADGFVVIDQYDDTLINVPFFGSGATSSVRSLYSNPSSSLPFDDPRAMVAYGDIQFGDHDTDPESPEQLFYAEKLMYVLNGNEIIAIDIAAVTDADAAELGAADPANSNRSEFLISGCTFDHAAQMLIRIAFKDDEGITVTDSATLIVAEANEPTLHIIDQADGSCESVSYNLANSESMDIVDMISDSSRSTDTQLELLMLDRGNREVFSVSVNIDEAAVAEPQIMSANSGANPMVSPLGMSYDANAERLYVLDDVLQSVYLIDVAARDPGTGRRLTQNESDAAVNGGVSGQRLVISRGTSLNCHESFDGGVTLTPCSVE